MSIPVRTAVLARHGMPDAARCDTPHAGLTGTPAAARWHTPALAPSRKLAYLIN